MRTLAKLGPMALMVAVVATVVWLGFRPEGHKAAPSPSPSPSAPPACHPVPGTQANGLERIATPRWEISVTSTHTETTLQGRTGQAPIEAGDENVFVVVSLSLTRIGRGEAALHSEGFVPRCESRIAVSPVGWSTGEGFCSDCTIDFETTDRKVSLAFVLELPRKDALQVFSLTYEDSEEMNFGPPRDL
jgi:hypothetical protein